MDKISSIKAAGIGAFGAVVIGLILALNQVQGWKMPTAIAVFFAFILCVLLALSIGLLCLVAIKAVKQIVERHATSATWVSDDAPGVLNCEVDGKRALDRFSKELRRFQVDINRLITQAEKHSKQINDMLTGKRTTKKAKTKQQRANRLGKQIDHSAIYIEKRTVLFETLTKEIVRNYEVMIATLNVTEEKDRRTAETLISGFENLDSAGAAVVSGVMCYKQGAELLGQSNLTKKIRETSKRLENSLDGMLIYFTQFKNSCHRLHTELAQKCANVNSSTPDKEGFQT